MSISFEEIQKALGLPAEINEWEFKEAAWALPKSIWETISAYANSGISGCILLGVKHKGKVFEVSGITDIEKVQNEFTSQIDHVFNVPLSSYIHIEPKPYNDKWMLVILTGEPPKSLKPVFIKEKSPIKGGYKRVGGSDLHLVDKDVERFYQERSIQPYEFSPMQSVKINELDPAIIQIYKKLLSLREPDSKILLYDDNRLLQSLKAVVYDENNKRWIPTIAGVLLFGSAEAIAREFPAFKVDIIDIDGTEWVPDYKERFKSYPSYQGSLLTIAAEILERMRKDIAIPFQLEPQTLTRIDETPQMTSLREAIRNALIHQDYQKRNPTQIRRFNDRIEIENPGYSLKPIERIGEPGSELRNPIIARVFSDIGWAEEKGSGIRAMQDAMDKAGLTPPIFESDTGSNLFRVTFRLHHFMTEEDLDWLQEHTEGHNLSDEEKKALILVRHTGSVNNLTYCQINHTDTLTASKSLARLRDKGFLVQSQVKGPGTYYVPAETLPTQTPDLFHPEPIKKTYKEKEESIKNRIAELCRTPHSAKELSLKLGKNRVYLVINYLSKMLKEGKLRRTNPAPKARNQKYFTENNRNHKK